MFFIRNDNKGLTLIEIIVALALLAIIIAAFTPLFANSYAGILTSGFRSQAQFSGQQGIENSIANPGSAADGKLTIPFSTPITVAGNNIKVNQNFTDSKGTNRTVTLNVFVPNELTIGSDLPPNGEKWSSYSHTFTAQGGIPPYTFNKTSGSLPDGLTLNENTGLLSGVPNKAGKYKFYITVTDSDTERTVTSGKEFVININE